MSSSPSVAPVRTEAAGAVTIITICRPERRNAVDRDTAAQLASAFREFEADDDAAVAVLRGEGAHFCAGADLKAIAEGAPNRTELDGDGPMGPTRMDIEKPVVAAIEGFAVAGGLELALWCDLRVAADDATLGVFCRRVGVPLIDGGTWRLPRLIGESRAMDLILTGREVSADEALDIGLVNRTAPSGRALEVAIELARLIASHPRDCMLADRASARRAYELDATTALREEGARAQPVLQNVRERATRFADRDGS